jgi:hypothetical protein
MSRLVLALLSVLALPAFAAQNACELLNPEEINLISTNKVEKVIPTKSGNPSECGFLDARKAAILTITVRDVQYAVKDEMNMERDNLEKIYRTHSKPVDTVGEGGYWMPVAHQLGFRKGKTIVSVRFGTPKNQNELDTSQIARVIETRLAKAQAAK